MALGTIFAGASLGLSALSAGINAFRGFPEFPVDENDINKLIDSKMQEALSQVASDTRRRLIGAGQEGSGSVNQSIQDNQSKIRRLFEDQRTTALTQLRQAQHSRDVNAFNQLGQTLEGITNLGFAGFRLGGGFGQQNQNLNQLNASNAASLAPVQDMVNNLSPGLPGLSQGFQGGFDSNTGSFGAQPPQLGIR